MEVCAGRHLVYVSAVVVRIRWAWQPPPFPSGSLSIAGDSELGEGWLSELGEGWLSESGLAQLPGDY